ncbi:UTP--glucose-1-phosphate uridylyltransferase GalU [uncultured Mailhella sp.]|uniref:UTP--glucose-1-phosphate uridylyltransferase GalU n=1 Tax=uncultured Mailhella sp. TaxID=1981031 RepID=UPI002615E83C|nr:UTP--glucose-1-phosphate uridylyltransferase GalU [uncultured Mailhella sp.]
MKISKVILPVAGWGTRSLPASKNIPKEMLPIFDKPVIQYVVEEAVRAGIHDVVFVTNRHKSVVEDYFDRSVELEELLEREGKTKQLEAVRNVAAMVDVMSVRQKEQRGLGHAVGCARNMIREDFFAVMVGDDFIVGDDAGLVQLVDAAEKYQMPAIGVMEVPADKIDKYGMVAGTEIAEGVFRITDMVEKPALGTMDSRLAIVGRYVLPSEIFDYIMRQKPGRGGEIQLTDALAAYMKEKGMLAVKMKGHRFDAGDWVDYLTACTYFGLKDEQIREPLKKALAAVLKRF